MVAGFAFLVYPAEWGNSGVMAFMVNLVNPGYMVPLFREPLGLMMVGAGVVLMGIGALIIRKLVDVDV